MITDKKDGLWNDSWSIRSAESIGQERYESRTLTVALDSFEATMATIIMRKVNCDSKIGYDIRNLVYPSVEKMSVNRTLEK